MQGMRYLLALALLAACNDDTSTQKEPPTEIGDIVRQDCGDPPLAPGWSVAFNNGTAKLSADQFHAIEAWSDAVAVWRDCVVTHP